VIDTDSGRRRSGGNWDQARNTNPKKRSKKKESNERLMYAPGKKRNIVHRGTRTNGDCQEKNGTRIHPFQRTMAVGKEEIKPVDIGLTNPRETEDKE